MSTVRFNENEKSWQDVRSSYEKTVSRNPSLKPLAWSLVVTAGMAAPFMSEHAVLEQLQRQMENLPQLKLRFVQPGANLTTLRAEFAEPATAGTTAPKMIELKGNGISAKPATTDERHTEWTDELEDERISLIETEEERDLKPTEAARLEQLMKWAMQAPRHRDPEGLRQHLAGLKVFSGEIAELERRSAELTERTNPKG